MEENPELEEGEAFSEGYNNNLDPDVALSYIDEKIQNVLGHFQKDFEGGVSAENLGAKFGGYGSFLPTYERSPQKSSVPSHPKTPQKNCSTERTPNNVSMEGASQSVKVPLNDASSVKLGIPSGSSNALQKSGLASGSVLVKKESKFAKNPLKSGSSSDQRTLKVRIKVGPDSLARKNAAIYSGLGLDISPSSSLGNSSEVSGGVTVQQNADKSPSSILQVMTSFPVPGGAMVSPLHDNLLCLIKKETFSRDVKPMPFLKGGQTNSSLLGKDPVSMGNEKVSRRKGAKFPMKSEKDVEVKEENDAIFGSNTTFSTEMKAENETLESKKVVSSNSKKVHLPGTVKFNGTLKVTGRPSEVSLDADEDGVGGNIVSSDLMREDSLESRSGHDSGKSEKRNAQTKSGLAENILEHQAVPSNDDGSVHLKGGKKSKKIKARAPSKIYPEASSRNMDTLPHGNLAPTEEKVFQQDAVSVQAESKMSPLKDKPLSVSENSHTSKINKKAVANGRLEICANQESNDLTIATHGVSKFKDKMQKLKFQDTSKLRDKTKVELKRSQNRLSEKPSGDWQRCSIIDRHDTSFDKSNEGFGVEGYSGKEVDNQRMPSSVKDAVNVGVSLVESTLAPEAAPPLQHEVKDSWVGCDKCEKWRLLPYGILPEDLPDKWTCKMLNWLPGMNRCDISEDVTTQALRDMYLVPLSVGQNHVQNDINRSTSEVRGQHLEHSHQSLDFPPGPTPGKKKHALKELAKAGVSNGMMRSSNSPNNQLRESVKSRSVNNMDQPPLEASLTNKSSKSRNMVAEVKQSPVIGGNIKQAKMKNKRDVDNDGYGDPKKAKIDVPDADKNCSSDTGSGKSGLNSKTGLSIKIRGHGTLKPSEGSFSGDMKSCTKERFPVSLKKPCGQSQMLSDGGSLNVRTSDKMNISLKKRKLKEWQDDQNGLNRTGNAEDSNESGLKKVKISNRGASVMCNSSEKLDKKEKMAHMLSSEGQDHAVDGEDAERRANKDQRPRKHRRSLTSEQHFDVAETSRKDLVTGQHSVTATSSSSKVSGSLKTRTPLDDVRGSPVESVSSSPLRIPFSEKLGPTRGDTLGKDVAKDCGPPVVDVTNKFQMGKKQKVSGGPRPDTSKTILSDRQDGDSIRKLHQTKSSSQLINGGCEITEKHKLSVDLSAAGNCNDEVIADKNLIENFPPSYKSSRGAPLQSKENGRSLVSDLDRDMKLSEPENAQVDIFNKRKKESEAGGGSHESLHKRMNCGKISISDKPSSKFSKDEKVHISKGNSVSQFSKDGRMERTLKHDLNDPNKKLVSLDCSEQNVGSRGNLQRPDNQIKVDSVLKELKTETLTPHMEGEVIHKSNIQQSAQGYQQERASHGHCTHASANAELSKTSRCPESSGKVNGIQSMLATRNVKDLTAPASASKQTASDALAEAKHWKDDADRVKGLGFGFESNEMNFQAALKFLHGASLLETSNEVGRQGEMTQMQAYNTSAKLCESCAVEYERRSEMAAAALAYKCMEVAHWRIVYCKSSSLSRDRNELQACLQAFPQGDSPSSSASDIDNLNNPATVDKAAVSKSAISHAAGNPVIVARNHSNFLRLLDFTQDVNFAVEATKKSQIAYSAANLAMEEAHNKDCIISVKKVFDFSYQDVEGFLDLVKQAMDAITRSGSVGKRD